MFLGRAGDGLDCVSPFVKCDIITTSQNFMRREYCGHVLSKASVIQTQQTAYVIIQSQIFYHAYCGSSVS